MLMPIFNNYIVVSGGACPVIVDQQLGVVSNGSPTDTVSITFGSAVTAGQLVILALYSGPSGGNAIVTPSGFTPLAGANDALNFGIYSKICTGSEGATFSIGTVDTAGELIAYKITGAYSTPLDATYVHGAGLLTSPGFPTAHDFELILPFIFLSTNTTVSAAPTGTGGTGSTFTLNGHDSGAHGGPISLAGAQKNQNTAGATGTFIWPSGTVFQNVVIGIRSQ